VILIALGFFILGFPSGCIDIPIMSDLLTTLKETHKYPENLANDLTSAIYTFANYIGESLGPIYGGFITYNYNFEFSCILTGLLNFLFLFLFAFMTKSIIFNNKPLPETAENSFVRNNTDNDNEKCLLREEIYDLNNQNQPEILCLNSDLKQKLI
jgi:MFS family permease